MFPKQLSTSKHYRRWWVFVHFLIVQCEYLDVPEMLKNKWSGIRGRNRPKSTAYNGTKSGRDCIFPSYCFGRQLQGYRHSGVVRPSIIALPAINCSSIVKLKSRLKSCATLSRGSFKVQTNCRHRLKKIEKYSEKMILLICQNHKNSEKKCSPALPRTSKKQNTFERNFK